MLEGPPKTLDEFVDWIVRIRGWISGSVDGKASPPVTNIQATIPSQRMFDRLLNLLVPASSLADLIRETGERPFETVSEFNFALARAEQRIREILPPPEPPESVRRRRKYARDHLWLEWYENRKLLTFHSPAKIRDKWNAENPKQAIAEGKQGIDTVKKAIALAVRERREQQGNIEIPPSA